MEDIKIIDDFLPKSLQDTIEELCVSPVSTYQYNKGTLLDIAREGFIDAEQFINLYIVKGAFVKDDYSHYLTMPLLIGGLREGLNIKLKDIYRAKCNLTLKQYKVPENHINPPHIDQGMSVGVDIAAIYYVNDSDGDTILYKGNIISDLIPIKKVTPKKGRLLIMSGNRFHSSSHPTKTDKRLVLNYNVKFTD